MKIIDINYKWNGPLVRRNATKYIILHHRAGNGDAESIHNLHLSWGWIGFGYHFYVRKDGSVYRGRPIEMVGAHCKGQNSYSVGICFEGNFENEKMSSAQLKAGQELVSYIKTFYPNADVKGHRDFDSTACPGKNFPFDTIKKGITTAKLTSAKDIIKKLSEQIEIQEVDRAVKALEKAKKEDSSLYWILYKIVNS
jgi:hypothetical protein